MKGEGVRLRRAISVLVRSLQEWAPVGPVAHRLVQHSLILQSTPSRQGCGTWIQANEDRHLCGTEFFHGLQLIECNIVPAADLLFDRPLNVGERELRIAIAGVA